jgi:DNA-binding protein YbaB
MTAETDPRLTDALQQTQQLMSALEDEKHRKDTETFTATDETGTVEAVVNGDRRLVDLRIEHGLLRLGAETVQQRIHEAVTKAQNSALTAGAGRGQRLEEILEAMVGTLSQQLGGLAAPAE